MKNSFRFTLITAAFALILVGTPARMPAASMNQVVINRTSIDYALNKITIVGANLGTSTPSVSWQGVELVVQSFNSTTGTVVATLPNALNPGSYLLSVTTTTGTPSTATFETAFGSTGATGATGPTGATGTAGTNGTNGATGATGPTGTAGTNGINGTNGATDPTGSTGLTGATRPHRMAGSQ